MLRITWKLVLPLLGAILLLWGDTASEAKTALRAFSEVSEICVRVDATQLANTHQEICFGYDTTASESTLVPEGGLTGNTFYRNALQPFKGQELTNAGRALTKHPEAVGLTKATLRETLRTTGDLNRAAAESLKDIMRNGELTTPTLPRYGDVVQFRLPSGTGARLTQAGEFIGFIQP